MRTRDIVRRAVGKCLGGPGSGNFGHSGRPGERGGSGEGGGGGGDKPIVSGGPKGVADSMNKDFEDAEKKVGKANLTRYNTLRAQGLDHVKALESMGVADKPLISSKLKKSNAKDINQSYDQYQRNRRAGYR
jgi:hypothetical protein